MFLFKCCEIMPVSASQLLQYQLTTGKELAGETTSMTSNDDHNMLHDYGILCVTKEFKFMVNLEKAKLLLMITVMFYCHVSL